MQVFKLYLKLFNAHKGQLIAYMAIFMSVLFFVIIPNSVKNEKNNYKDRKVIFDYLDEDSSTFSSALTEYLKSHNKLHALKNHTPETIQDELYASNIQSYLTIKKGFSEHISSDDAKAYVCITTLDNTYKNVYFENQIDAYLSKVNAYLSAGYSAEEAISHADSIMDIGIEVNYAENGSSGGHSAMYFFFSYLVWILVCAFILVIAPTLNSINGQLTKYRINCSSYKFSRINYETNLGLVATALGVVVILFVFAAFAFKGDVLTLKGLFCTINLIAYSSLAVAFALLISKLTSSDPIISMYANVISLGMAFLSGVFVPFELLSDTVIKIAHFLPSYYYMVNLVNLEKSTTINYGSFFTNAGIQLLFAVALIVIAVVLEKSKKMES